MIIMALDHTRDFFGQSGISPTDVARAGSALFFTRWVTNICAPVFFLLTGTGAYLSLRRKSKAELSRFLLSRGLWLIFLDAVILRCFAMQFNFDYHITLLIVIWALGWAMIVLSALIYLPDFAVTGIGCLLIVSHNLLDSVPAKLFGAFAPLWNILHVQGFVITNPQHMVFVAYPLIPWVGVTAAGYGLGQIFGWPPARRRVFLFRLGIGLVVAFLILRTINVYGDPTPWALHPSPLLSFLNTNKYPPSLLFLLMTLGPATLLLALFTGRTPRLLAPALVYGRVPLFYYALHFFLIHVLAVVICYAIYGHVHWMFESPSLAQYPFTRPPGWGFSLPITYLIWISIVVALYPVCKWFGSVKRRSSSAWLSYL